ncbi:hypothetical protein SERLA73DRAFT_179255 [Serpula lacrymans var. lacrymans S7.3]|uniref:Uncharacterized protein n=2 Tax=Serpula lacrymans var. lacrymans TaxID=341189 RepID=F8PRM1_SERL3|nr:uncharacterized protein SERLADRAFT_464284 [Serpula lacrymans var. lacrymans S7.9]EGO01160.1 hypothetical protein SERLA73DRAFT_179255 [Serpula lacrymans var. lacrymans S7.3]EGO26811.1 hypothetical protein SERLADRAFT_464284 [Serpula lacrymans var. lacrymans S7.9]
MSVLVAAKFPSITATLVSCAVSAFFLLLIRLVLSVARAPYFAKVYPSTDSLEKISIAASLSFFTSGWYHNLHWDALPPFLPFSMGQKSAFQVGTGMSAHMSPKASEAMAVSWRSRRPRPNFQPPLAALYENPVPLSMAKIIMSRHTFRRPNPNRARQTAPSLNRPPTQPTSRLFHSIA